MKKTLATAKEPQPPDSSVMRELAVEANVDPRTIQRALLGLPVRGMSGHRAREVLRRAGYLK